MNKNLPIFAKKDDIVASVKNYDVTIIAAETGSGKSTQVPQYLYEAGYGVIVTNGCISYRVRIYKDERHRNSVLYRRHSNGKTVKTDRSQRYSNRR